MARLSRGVRARDAQLTKPPGSLGRLEEIVAWMAAWQSRDLPRVERPVVAVFAGNHGVVAQGVAAYPQAVTAQMVANFQNGGAAVNQICKTFDLGLKVFELALERPPATSPRMPPWTKPNAPPTMAYGMEATAGGCDLLCVGEMGIGNTTIAAALAHGSSAARRKNGSARHGRRQRRPEAQGRCGAPRRGAPQGPSR